MDLTIIFIALSLLAGFVLGYWFCNRGKKAAISKITESIGKLNNK